MRPLSWIPLVPLWLTVDVNNLSSLTVPVGSTSIESNANPCCTSLSKIWVSLLHVSKSSDPICSPKQIERRRFLCVSSAGPLSFFRYFGRQIRPFAGEIYPSPLHKVHQRKMLRCCARLTCNAMSVRGQHPRNPKHCVQG